MKKKQRDWKIKISLNEARTRPFHSSLDPNQAFVWDSVK